MEPKKIVAKVLCTALIISTLTGCGQQVNKKPEKLQSLWSTLKSWIMWRR